MLIWQCAPRAGVDREKIMLTGFGNVDSVQAHLPLTTIDQHPFEMGSQAAEHLIFMIEKGFPDGQWIHDIMDVELLLK